MQQQLMKACQQQQLIDMMYIAKDGSITKRRVKILQLSHRTCIAYCFTRKAKRTFLLENILAVTPVVYHERSVI